VPLEAVGEGAIGKTPWITPDGLQLYFAAARPDGPGGNDLWWIERPDRTSPWGAARLIPNVNTGMEEYAPSLSSDGLQLLFTRSNTAPSAEELWLTRRDSVSAEWREPESLSINDPRAKDSDPVFSPDGLEVWWVRGISNTDHDLYSATRATHEESFAMSTPAEVLNSTAWEGDPWLSADGREIVFFSNRTGERLLYRATR
jgi:Tol biopolymer transport system component